MSCTPFAVKDRQLVGAEWAVPLAAADVGSGMCGAARRSVSCRLVSCAVVRIAQGSTPSRARLRGPAGVALVAMVAGGSLQGHRRTRQQWTLHRSGRPPSRRVEIAQFHSGPIRSEPAALPESSLASRGALTLPTMSGCWNWGRRACGQPYVSRLGSRFPERSASVSDMNATASVLLRPRPLHGHDGDRDQHLDEAEPGGAIVRRSAEGPIIAPRCFRRHQLPTDPADLDRFWSTPGRCQQAERGERESFGAGDHGCTRRGRRRGYRDARHPRMLTAASARACAFARRRRCVRHARVGDGECLAGPRPRRGGHSCCRRRAHPCCVGRVTRDLCPRRARERGGDPVHAPSRRGRSSKRLLPPRYWHDDAVFVGRDVATWVVMPRLRCCSAVKSVHGSAPETEQRSGSR